MANFAGCWKSVCQQIIQNKAVKGPQRDWVQGFKILGLTPSSPTDLVKFKD